MNFLYYEKHKPLHDSELLVDVLYDISTGFCYIYAEAEEELSMFNNLGEKFNNLHGEIADSFWRQLKEKAEVI